MSEIVTLILKLPRDTQISPESTQIFLSALININKKSLYSKLTGKSHKSLFLEIVLKNQEINFQITCDSELAGFIEAQIQAAYPFATIVKIKKAFNIESLTRVSLILKNGSYYPIKTYSDFKDIDPMNSILTVLSKSDAEDKVLIQYDLESVDQKWQRKAEAYANHGIKREDGTYTPRADQNVIKEKISSPGFGVWVNLFSNNKKILNELTQAFNVFTRPDGNGFLPKGRFSKNGQILNIEEVATLWHLPSNKTKLESISWSIKILSEPPQNIPIYTEDVSSGINFFARTQFKNKEATFGIKDNDRRRHIWAIGKTGTGKSTMLANMAIDDIRKGRGIAIIDPHGDLCDLLLDYIPASRINDVIYFNPSDKKYPVAINPLEVKNKTDAELVVSGIISIFNKIFGNSWGPRLEYILRNSLLTLAEIEGSTLKDIPMLLTDHEFRNKIVTKISDETLKNFWVNEFNKMPVNLQKEAISPILNKVGQFVTSPLIRNIIDQAKSSIDFEDIMNDGKIFLVNLSQGKIGEDNAQLLGAMIITKLQLSAMKRVNTPEKDRKDFYLYVDEFQNFATNSFIKILSEARKYHLNLILANQYLAQIPFEVQKAILGNAGTLISFAIGAEDSQILKREFAEVFSENDLVNLTNFEIAIKLMIDGYGQRPFLAKTLPLPNLKNNNKEKIIKVSKERWGIT